MLRQGIKMTSVEASIEHLKSKLQAASDKEVANSLGIDASTVAAWRRRGSVPLKYIAQANAIADRINTSDGVMPASINRLTQIYSFALVGSLATEISQRMLIGLDSEQRDIITGKYLRSAYAFYESQLGRIEPKSLGELRHTYDRLRKSQEDDLIWLDTLPDPMTI